MKTSKYAILVLLILTVMSCNTEKKKNLDVEIYETSESGNKLTRITKFSKGGQSWS